MTVDLSSLPKHELRPLSPRQIRQLTADLNQNRVVTRKQGSSSLSYVEAWDVRRTLTRVFGFGGWSEIIDESQLIKVETDIPRANGNGTTAFRVTARTRTVLYIHQLGALFSGEAVASQAGAVLGDVADFTFKTCASDAFKRAAMNLGTQFGLSLYDNGSTEDVVGVLLPVGQRKLDVDYAAMLQAKEDKQMIKELEEYQAKGAVAPDEPQQPQDRPVAAEAAPEGVEVPVDPQNLAQAQSKVSGAFGG